MSQERSGPEGPESTARDAPSGALPDTPPAPTAEPPFERRWTWMDRWDPSTWEMPSNPTTLQRVLAAVALLIVAFATFYLPFKLLGVF